MMMMMLVMMMMVMMMMRRNKAIETGNCSLGKSFPGIFGKTIDALGAAGTTKVQPTKTATRSPWFVANLHLPTPCQTSELLG